MSNVFALLLSFGRTFTDSVSSRLDFGWLAYLHVGSSTTKTSTPLDFELAKLTSKPTKICIRALCKLSPVIKGAIYANGSQEVVDHIVLLPGKPDAYRHILSWLDSMLVTGEIKQFPIVEEKPLTTYHDVLAIGRALAISPIVEALQRRYDNMLEHRWGEEWHVPFDDFREVYGKNRDEYADLRKRMVEKLAKTWVDGRLGAELLDNVKGLFSEFDEFRQEMKEKMQELSGK